MFKKKRIGCQARKENCFRINDGNGRLALEDVEVRRIWKKYSEAPYNLNTPEQVTVHMCGFHGVRRCNYFGGMPIRRNEV